MGPIGFRAHLCAILAAVVLLSPVALVSGGSDDVPDEVILRIGFTKPVDTLNPLIALGDTSKFFFDLLYDSLMSLGPDMEPVPNLATAWRIVPESDPALVLSGEPYGSVWEYDITTNATWHDGTPFSAADVVFTINVMCQFYISIWSHHPYTYFMSNAEEVADNTVRIHFYDRETGEPMACSFGDSLYIPILPKHKLIDQTPSYIGFTWTGIFEGSAPPIVGTGPFRAPSTIWSDWVQMKNISLSRSLEYHGYGDFGTELTVDRIELCHFDDANNICDALRNGSIDIASLSREDYLALKDSAPQDDSDISMCASLSPGNKIKVLTFTLTWSTYSNEVIVDPAVRRALSYATDKGAILESTMSGLGVEGSTLLSPVWGDWHCELTEDELHGFDVQRANQVLDDAGYPVSEVTGVRVASADSFAVTEEWAAEGTLLEFTLVVQRHDGALADALVDMYAEIGVRVVTRVIDEISIAHETLCPIGYSMGVFEFGRFPPTPCATLFTQSSRAIGGWSDNAFSDPEYDDSFNSSVQSLDPEDRLAHVLECQRVQYEEVGYVNLAYPYDLCAWRTDRFENLSERMSDPGTSILNFWGGAAVVQGLEEITEEDTETLWDEPVLWAGVIAAVVVVSGLAVYMLYRKGQPPAP